jgi:hypothetical protein
MFEYTVLADIDTLQHIADNVDKIRSLHILSVRGKYAEVCKRIDDLMLGVTDKKIRAYCTYLYCVDKYSDASVMMLLALRRYLPEEFWEIEHANRDGWIRYVIAQEKGADIRDIMRRLTLSR